jgi:hypothetical protein
MQEQATQMTARQIIRAREGETRNPAVNRSNPIRSSPFELVAVAVDLPAEAVLAPVRELAGVGALQQRLATLGRLRVTERALESEE